MNSIQSNGNAVEVNGSTTAELLTADQQEGARAYGEMVTLERAKLAGATGEEVNRLEAILAQRPLTPADGVEVKETLFKVGWNYPTFLVKNEYSPSETRSEQWKQLSRDASRAQMALMGQLHSAGAKTKVGAKAVWNGKDKRFDTALTARLVQPGCKDADLILDTLTKAQARQAKMLSDMRAGAAAAGVLPRQA